jgi:hydrogenase nickel incorporation protein HypB
MCKTCGCGKTAVPGARKDHPHPQTRGHSHTHGHEHDHGHEHQHERSRTVTIEQRILAENDATAEQNRRWLTDRGVVALNLISSPGTGKTMLIEKTLDRLNGVISCAVITGDLRTDNDARRLMNRGAAVRQIETHDACHLNAAQVGRLFPEIVTEGVRLLFIENVGNLVCPAAFDLGEHFKVALLSTTEGEDKPEKYPAIFSQAPVAILTKMDLAPHLDWDAAKCLANLRKVRPGVFVFEVSARTGHGMDAWIAYLHSLAPK